MSEERKKKSGAAWKVEEDEKLNQEHLLNSLSTEKMQWTMIHISLYLPNFILSCIRYKQRHTLCSPAIVSVLQARLVPQSPTGCF